MKRSLCEICGVFMVILFSASLSAQESAAFTYQGLLQDQGTPARGDYDFSFELFDAAKDGQGVAGPLVMSAVPVRDGLLTVVLDFGVPLTRAGRWLEIGVRPTGQEVFTFLAERQELLPVPYAITATSVSPGAVTSDMLASGAVTTEKIARGAVTGEQIDDGGRADYEALTRSVQGLGVGEVVSFGQLTPVIEVEGPPPSLDLTVGGLPFGEVIGFVGDEGMSRAYSYVVQVRSSRDLGDPNLQIRLPATLTFVRNGRSTRFEGRVGAMVLGASKRSEFLYSVRIEPALADLALSTDYQITQSRTVPEVATVYYEQGTSEVIESRLDGEYATHESLIQYGETDLDFIGALLEEEGIFFYFDPAERPPRLVLGDSVSAYAPGLELTLSYYGDTASGIPAGAEFVRTFRRGLAQEPAKADVKTYDFKRPAIETSGSDAGPVGWGATYEFGTDVATDEYVVALARTRRLGHDIKRLVLCGTSTAPDLRPGHVFRLEDRSASGLEGSYLVTAVRHAGFVREAQDVRTLHYGNVFDVIPADVRFVPARVTPRPRALPCTAEVTGPAGEEVYVDEYGRVKVQFHWDREGENDENSSGWVRVASPVAGSSHGLLFLPRVGDEVLVTFIQGDPDQPLIIGSLWNAEAVPPYALPDNKTRSTIRSSGRTAQANELRFEDAIGNQELYLQAAKDMTLRVQNDLSTTVDNQVTASAGADTELTVLGNLDLQVGGTTTFTGPETQITSADVRVNGSATVTGSLAVNSALAVDGSLAARDSLSIGRGTLLNRVQAGQAAVPDSATQATAVTFSFPRAFGEVPRMVLTVEGNPKTGLNHLFAASIRTISTTNCTVNVARLDAASGWLQPLALNWIAWE